MKKLDLQAAKDAYPSTMMGEGEWIAAFDRNPDMLWTLISDLYSVSKAIEEREQGIKRYGRRPRQRANSVDEVWATVFPARYSLQPFPEAASELLAKRKMSARALAIKVPIHQTTLSKYLRGAAKPDLSAMEAIAEGLRVHPAYFVEWRAQFMAACITEHFVDNPNLSIGAWQTLRAATQESA